jgi:hypothetical protein
MIEDDILIFLSTLEIIRIYGGSGPKTYYDIDFGSHERNHRIN